MTKEKSCFDKIEELHGKEGVISLSDTDRKMFIMAEDRTIHEESEKKEKHIWLLIGIGVGIFGNFIVSLFYDWLKNFGGWNFVIISFFIFIGFLMCCYLLFYKLTEHNQIINHAVEKRKMWRKAKSIKVGASLEAKDIED